ncbi:MAG: hypothetical protein KDD02_14100 [Phaeodactylibacter sp.]|nr:hypothetical protein [Phaeodactylibacter sp.]MCB9301122.1 hypothetical protein [Lewinellaceae bacterium]
MRLNNFLSLLAAVTMTVALSMGCQKDKDPDRLAFLGSYTVIEACSITGNHEYQMIITESTTEENDIVINNFGDFNNGTARATVSGKGLTIPAQTINIAGTAVNIANGTGSLNGNLLTISYTYSIGADSESCSMTCTKL